MSSAGSLPSTLVGQCELCMLHANACYFDHFEFDAFDLVSLYDDLHNRQLGYAFRTVM